MNKRVPFLQKILAVLLAAILLGGCAAEEPKPDVPRRSGAGFYFDTVVTATLYGAEDGLLEEIWALCSRYEQLLSKTVEGSDVWRINHAEGETVTVDGETWQLLRRAKEISSLTGGAFSVTIAPLVEMWDFTGGTQRMPTDEQRIAALPLVNDEAMVLGENHTVTMPKGMEIDLGGIAKGYIADQAAAMLKGRAAGAILSLGGNVYVLGQKPDGTQYRVGIRDPRGDAGSVAAIVTTADRSVVTSGIYERQFEKDGVVYHHILDPVDGLPSGSDLASATIISESSMDADALATACIVLGSEKAQVLLEHLRLDGVLILRDGTILNCQYSDAFQLEVLE